MEEKCKAANDAVIFTGRDSNVKEYLYASDLLISASSAEGLPYAILEAECTGIPMILSDIPQHREALGENVGYVQFFDAKNISEIQKLLKNNFEPRTERVGYQTGSFSAIHMTEKYENLYRLKIEN